MTEASNSIFRLQFIDVFDMLSYEIAYMDDRTFFFGSKTLGLIFFFVPRALWTSKASLIALDMGVDLTNARLAGTPNLSLFLAGDFYADLGIPGVILGAIATSLVLFMLIDFRRKFLFQQNITSYVLVGAMPILIRGPFGANAPLTFSTLVALVLLRTLAVEIWNERPKAQVSPVPFARGRQDSV